MRLRAVADKSTGIRHARLFLVVAGALLCATLACPAPPPGGGAAAQSGSVISARAGRVTLVEGEVMRRPPGGGEVQPLREGAALDDGDVVLTLDRAHADWSLTPDSYLHVGPGALVTARATAFDRMHFDVERGEVLIVARSLKKGVSLVVHTPPGLLTIHKPGRYLFRVAEGGATEATVGQGELRYGDGRGKVVRLKKGRKVEFRRAEKGIEHDE